MIKQWLSILPKRMKTKSIDIVMIKTNYNIDELGDSFIPVHLLNQQ
ncbi:hypothetical protein GCM10023211_16210 [Orbus sasakiae]|uniref:Uncharacterized protein n=1 Tax=Orbus sasakiae TaxID=1078475 RepID=A0ABP9N978_9GAMM